MLSESEIMRALVQHGFHEAASKVLIWNLRRQFEAMGLLDPTELRTGSWAFVSFPASLLGHSWLTTLATPGQSLMPIGYWDQDAPERDKEEQRELLHRLETRRVRLNPSAPPIRVVHVAWAWIRLGNSFLMYRREDKHRPGQKSFGLPGGRFNLNDLPIPAQTQEDLLRQLLRPDSEIVANSLHLTLERELMEETALTAGAHYSYEPYGDTIPPYLEVNGAGNRHAYSSYHFRLYHVKLTHSGETHLIDQISRNPTELKWFSISDIAAPQRSDGDSAYIDALHRAWGDRLPYHLSNIPDSGAGPLAFSGESMTLDLPGIREGVFKFGKSGKEKPNRLPEALLEEEWHLLMLLGWHAREFGIQTLPNAKVRVLGNGWIDAEAEIQLVRSLYEKMEPALQNLLEIRDNRYVSLRIAPEILFFPIELFRYKISGSNIEGGVFRLIRHGIATKWGLLEGSSYEKQINGNTVSALRMLVKGDDPPGDWARTLREQLGTGLKELGMRRLWIENKASCCLVEGLLVFSDT